MLRGMAFMINLATFVAGVPPSSALSSPTDIKKNDNTLRQRFKEVVR